MNIIPVGGQEGAIPISLELLGKENVGFLSIEIHHDPPPPFLVQWTNSMNFYLCRILYLTPRIRTDIFNSVEM